MIFLTVEQPRLPGPDAFIRHEIHPLFRRSTALDAVTACGLIIDSSDTGWTWEPSNCPECR